MGPLLISPTYLESQDDKRRVAVNVRAPKGEASPEELANTIEQKLLNYAEQQDMDMQVEVEISDWMLRDPQGAWLQTLLNIFGDTTGQKANRSLPPEAPSPSCCLTPLTSAPPCQERKTPATRIGSSRNRIT